MEGTERTEGRRRSASLIVFVGGIIGRGSSAMVRAMLRRLALAWAVAHSVGAAAQVVEFPNVSPAVSVRLEAGSTLTVDANGNLHARCDAALATGCAVLGAGGGAGGCSGPANFTQSLRVSSPTTPGPYPAGSTLSVVATVSNAAICSPTATVNGSATSLSGWNNPIVPGTDGGVAATVTLPAIAGASVVLRLTCYGGSGAAAQNLTVGTSSAPPAAACPYAYPTATAYTSQTAGSTTITPLGAMAVRNINGFEELINRLGFNVNPFPSTGTTGNLLATWNTIRVIRFEVPNPFPQGSFSRRFQFISWPNGFHGGLDAYISVSTCPGDLRIPTGQQSGTPSDPTYAEACRNWRGFSWTFEDTGQGDLPYVVGVPGQPNISTPSQCVLEPGRTYYLNIFMSKPNKNSRSLFPFQPICPGNFECGHGISVGG
jgi:hypothetical protein